MNKKYIYFVVSIFLAAMLVLGIAACGKTIGTGNGKDAVVKQETESAAKKDTSTKKTDTTKKSDSEKKEEKTTVEAQSSNGGNASSAGAETAGGGSAGGGNSEGGGYTPPAQPEPQPPTEAPTEPPTEPPAPTWTISVTVDGSIYGGVFASGTYTFSYQPTAFDALTVTGLPYSGSGYYISGINGLSEFDHGKMSGWLYSVNGVYPGYGCGDYYLNNGDSVYWLYHYGDE